MSGKGAPAPESAVTRLSHYLRRLEQLRAARVVKISSRRLGEAVGCTGAQVRKDLARFGQFGRPGIGYPVDELAAALRRILGTHHRWNTALVGVGNLGSALVRYEGFKRRGFVISCAFDRDPERIGIHVGSLAVRDVSTFGQVVRENRIRLGIIAVGAGEAQEVADMMTAAGIEGILNFAPVEINVPEGVTSYTVDLAVSLERITYRLVHRDEEKRGTPSPAP